MTWVDQARLDQWHAAQRKPFNVPPRFADAHPAGLPIPELRAVVVAYLADFDRQAALGVAPAFFGKARTFKTYAACVIGRWVAADPDGGRLEAHFIDAGSRLHELERARYDAGTRDYLAWVKRVPFLILDDITNVRDRSWAADLMVEIATERFNDLRPTLYTGNSTFSADDLKRLADLYGTCLARRIFDGAQGFRFVVS
jgi:DNA replication protein DnaC